MYLGIRVPPDISVRHAFQAADVDDDGYINYAQFRQVLHKLGAYLRITPGFNERSPYQNSIENIQLPTYSTLASTEPTPEPTPTAQNAIDLLEDLPKSGVDLLPLTPSFDDVDQQVHE